MGKKDTANLIDLRYLLIINTYYLVKILSTLEFIFYFFSKVEASRSYIFQRFKTPS